jgi:type II secretory pathway pseudopilin PulG
MRRQAGFTLLEIAIALVTIGLLFGATLAGQELMTGARVRNLIAQQDAVQAAYLAFQDRYRGYPGDYAQAMRTIPDVAADGNGNGRIEPPGGSGGGGGNGVHRPDR